MSSGGAKENASSQSSNTAVPGAEVLKPGSAAAIWLHPERFEAQDFSAEACIADLRRYVPLTTIKSELQTCISNVKNKLVEVLNEDYAEYISLSGKLGSVDGAILRMRQPLMDIQGQLNGVQQQLENELSTLQQSLQRRQEVAQARRTLELLQEIAHVVSKVEKLLQEVAAATPSSGSSSSSRATAAAGAASGGSSEAQEGAAGTDREARSRLLERVAVEASRLLYLANRGKDLAFVASMDKRIGAAKRQLDRHLQQLLLESLAAGDWGPALHCLHGHVELGDPGRGEEALRSGLVRGVVREVVQEAKAAAGTGGRESLAPVAEQLVPRLLAAAGPLWEALLAPGGSLAALEPLGAVVLAEVVDAISDIMPGVFSPGQPAAFHHNYLAGAALLAAVEGMGRNRKAVEGCRGSAAAASWAKRWNLAVYFSLLYQDIAGSFEEVATASQLELTSKPSRNAPSSPTASPWRLKATAVLAACMAKCTDPATYLVPLGDRFLRLLLQLLARYRSWLQEVVTARREAAAKAAAAAAAAAAAGPGAAAAAAAGEDGSTGGAGSPAGAAAGTAAPAAKGPAGWAGGASVDDLVMLLCDVQHVQAHASQAVVPALLQLLVGVAPEVLQQVEAAVATMLAALTAPCKEVLVLLSEEVVEKCVAVVRQLKGITATYRMTSKGPPVRHSHYVTGVMTPLRQLLDAPGPMQQLPPPLRLQLAEAVAEGVNVKYHALAAELLTTVRKTESSLKRLKKLRPGESESDAAAAGAGMSDSDKITLQLYLDVQEHGRQLGGFGLVAESMDSYNSLLAVVTLQQQQQQQQQPSPAK